MSQAIDKEIFDRVSDAFLTLTKKFENLGRENEQLKEKYDQLTNQKSIMDKDRRHDWEELERTKIKMWTFEKEIELAEMKIKNLWA